MPSNLSSKVILEVCVDSVTSAVTAEKYGASRIELCSGLAIGGLTPSAGLIQRVRSIVSIPIYVLIRPREGDFLYSDDEIKTMKENITICKQANVDGVVFGALNSDGTVNVTVMKQLIHHASPLQITFHRAIDMCVDSLAAIPILIQLGCSRVLTSGGMGCAVEGLSTIKKMQEIASNKIIIMPGGGITPNNVKTIVNESGVIEIHASGRSSSESKMIFRRQGVHMGSIKSDEYFHKFADSKIIAGIIQNVNQGNIEDSSPMKKMDTHKYKLLLGGHIHVMYFDSVSNTNQLLRELHNHTLETSLSLINPTYIFDPMQIVTATDKARMDQLNNTLKTGNIYSEIVFNLSDSTHIPSALQKFGLSPEGRKAIVVTLNEKDNKIEELVKFVKGDLLPNTKLKENCDTKILIKRFKIKEKELLIGSKDAMVANAMNKKRKNNNGKSDVENIADHIYSKNLINSLIMRIATKSNRKLT